MIEPCFPFSGTFQRSLQLLDVEGHSDKCRDVFLDVFKTLRLSLSLIHLKTTLSMFEGCSLN